MHMCVFHCVCKDRELGANLSFYFCILLKNAEQEKKQLKQVSKQTNKPNQTRELTCEDLHEGRLTLPYSRGKTYIWISLPY